MVGRLFKPRKQEMKIYSSRFSAPLLLQVYAGGLLSCLDVYFVHDWAKNDYLKTVHSKDRPKIFRLFIYFILE